ncbi:MAG: hypothetical protein ACUVS2_11245 [Candidatus Flexifilum sp.]|jgi:hypothetical protein
MAAPARHWLTSGIALLLSVLMAAALAVAQDVAGGSPDLIAIASLSIDEPVLAAAFPADSRLVALHGSRAAVYDIVQNGSPGLRLRSSVLLDGYAGLLAAGAGYALTATATSDGEFLTIIAPSTYNPRRGWEAVSLFQLPDETLSLASGQTWGIVGLENGYAALEIPSPDIVNHRLIDTGRPVSHAALFADTAFIAYEDEPALHQVRLLTGPSVAAGQSIALSDAVIALAISEMPPLAAALLADRTVILFDPVSGTITASTTTSESIDSLIIAHDEGGVPCLVLAGSDRAGVQLICLDPATASLTDAFIELPAAPTAIAARGALLALADADSIAVYRLHRSGTS